MASRATHRKRKSTADELLSESDEEFEVGGLLDGGFDSGEEEDLEEDEDAFDSSEDSQDGDEANDGSDGSLDSEEIPSDNEASGKRPSSSQGLTLDALQLAEEEHEQNFRISKDANGNPRYIYPEIVPDYDSDDTDVLEPTNTIGDIPLSFYDSYPHIGYDINGKKIMRPAAGEALDALLDSIDIPKGFTGLTDPSTGKPLELSQDELEILKRIRMQEIPEEQYDPYEPTVEWFTSKTEIMPLNAATEPKRRFIPSLHEAKRVMKIVRAIRDGRILPYKPPREQEEEAPQMYDIWANEVEKPPLIESLPPPKLPPPTHDESYNPPAEFLPSETERKEWQDAEPEDREKEYLPAKYSALRKVPGYDKFLKERFERCLDLYLAPRVRRTKLNIDPNSLLPKLPSPEELRPFPSVCATVYRGHVGKVRTISVSPSGVWVATGGDDGTVRVWELLTGREVWQVDLDNGAVNAVRWRPGTEAFVLAACAGDSVFLSVPPVTDPETEAKSRTVLDAGFGYAVVKKDAAAKEPPTTWRRPDAKLEASGVLVEVIGKMPPKTLAWHRRGDYLVTSSPTSQQTAVMIHTLSKHASQLPFRKLKGLAQDVHFHPTKPILFVATQKTIRCYDLQQQTLVKTLQPGARWISGFDIHPGGENVVVGSYDRRLLWHDLELSTKPYKILRYHERAIRSVKYHHGGFPLFASASDDGTIQVFHGKVVGDLMANATIVPLKMLKGHSVVGGLGVLELDWCKSEAWAVSCGADGTARLWM